MSIDPEPRIGYILKRYPRYSETFVVNEILAHEKSGLNIEIFALRPPCDGHFQSIISEVRSHLTYLPYDGIKPSAFWAMVGTCAEVLPNLWDKLPMAQHEDSRTVYQALVIANQAKRTGITHFHAHFATSATTVARLAGAFCDLPYTFTAHAKDIYHKDVCVGDLRRKICDATTAITISHYNLEYLYGLFGDDISNVVIIYNGLDLSTFPYKDPSNADSKIVSVGRLIEKKGFDVLIDACSMLAQRKVSFSCEIIGAGELKEQLDDQIQAARLKGTVELLGPRPQSEVITHLQEAAIFAAPCVVGDDGNRDGLPTVLLEAMALGTPCVSTDVTGIPEIIRDGETGLMVPQHDAESLANALQQLINEKSLRIRLAQNARRFIEKNFDIHANTAQQRTFFHAPSESPLVSTTRVSA